jgi:hypothetical protein
MEVNSRFEFAGNSSIWGNYQGTVMAQDLYSFSAAQGIWLISREVWKFTSFNIQFPAG